MPDNPRHSGERRNPESTLELDPGLRRGDGFDLLTVKVGRVKALLRQIASEHTPVVFANSLGTEGITNLRGIVCLFGPWNSGRFQVNCQTSAIVCSGARTIVFAFHPPLINQE